MKKLSLFILFLMLSVVVSAGAQNHIGVVGGLNVANLSEDETDFSSLTGFGIGGVIDLGLKEKIALRLEPMYIQKGAEFSDVDDDLGNIQVEAEVGYLEIPVLLKFALSSNTIHPYALVGPTIAFNLSSNVDLKAAGVVAEVDIKDVTKTVDFGFGFGGGLSFPAGNKAIFIEGRYTIGLTDIIDDGSVNVLGETADFEGNIKTRGFQIMAGITFPVGGGY